MKYFVSFVWVHLARFGRIAALRNTVTCAADERSLRARSGAFPRSPGRPKTCHFGIAQVCLYVKPEDGFSLRCSNERGPWRGEELRNTWDMVCVVELGIGQRRDSSRYPKLARTTYQNMMGINQHDEVINN